MTDRESDHWSIGEVLSLIQEEFPDVTISKIRFLESQGLINPERTPSGYRRFFQKDFERLQWILRQQRDNYLPLKVIRARLESGDLDGENEIDTSPVLPFDGPGQEPSRAQPRTGQPLSKLSNGATPGPELENADASALLPPDELASNELATLAANDVDKPKTLAAPQRIRPENDGLIDHEPGLTDGSASSSDQSSSIPQDKVSSTSGQKTVVGPENTGPENTDPVLEVLGFQDTDRPSAAVDQTKLAVSTAGAGPSSAVDEVTNVSDGQAASEPHPVSQAQADIGTQRRRSQSDRRAGDLASSGSRTERRGRGADRRGQQPAAIANNSALTKDELAEASGCSLETLGALERFGLLSGRTIGPTVLYDSEALLIAQLAAKFVDFGLEPRHLRAFKIGAEREVSLLTQVIEPLLYRRDEGARRASLELLDEMVDVSADLRAILVRQMVRQQLPSQRG